MSDSKLPLSAVFFRSVIVLALVAAGGAIVAGLVATKPDAGRNAGDAPPPRIAVVELQPLPIERFVRAYGTARAMDTADVPARVGAVVESLGANYAVGGTVKQGELLVRLDAIDFDKQIVVSDEAIRGFDAQMALLDTQARAFSQAAELAASDRELAAADLARVEAAAGEGAAQPREVDRARGALIAATRASVVADDALAQIGPRRQALAAQRAGEEARRDLARLAAKRCAILAPIDGVIQLAELEQGESVVPGTVVARIVNRTRIEVPLRIPASSRALAPVGAAVEIVARDGTHRSQGVVARVAPEDDPASRTAAVFVELAQEPDSVGALAPGAFVEARIVPGGSEPRIAVPRRAIRDEQVATVENGRIRMRRITVGFRYSGPIEGAAVSDSDWAVLEEPLPAGTLVVLDGARSLTEGQAVEPVRPSAAAAAGEVR